jgi:hypothetical protein
MAALSWTIGNAASPRGVTRGEYDAALRRYYGSMPMYTCPPPMPSIGRPAAETAPTAAAALMYHPANVQSDA